MLPATTTSLEPCMTRFQKIIVSEESIIELKELRMIRSPAYGVRLPASQLIAPNAME